jgi:uncharacterized protein YjbI with pentapeptide repeats
MTQEEIQGIREGRNKNLIGVDLAWVDLSEANLSGADLSEANLRGTRLRGANLRGANLTGADLRRANLSGANLIGANLAGDNLIGANLIGANLIGANLIGANLIGANLIGANLTRANLTRANLTRANLERTDLERCRAPQTIITPAGVLLVWRKCQTKEGIPVIVQLEIPKDARRSNATGRKCRSDKALPVKIEGGYDEVYSLTVAYPKKTYRVGEMVYCDEWEEDWTVECGGGIHWFLTREEAEAVVS